MNYIQFFVSVSFDEEDGIEIEVAGWAWTTWKETVEPSDCCWCACCCCCWDGMDIVAEAGNETIWIWVGFIVDWSIDWLDWVDVVFTAENCLSTWEREELAVCGNIGTACWTFWVPKDDVVIDIIFGDPVVFAALLAFAWLFAAAANNALTVWLPEDVTLVSVDMDGNTWDLDVEPVEVAFGVFTCCGWDCLFNEVIKVVNVDDEDWVGWDDNICCVPLFIVWILIVCVCSPVVAKKKYR